ncbi:hypothetical protein E2562_020172 [Oryza meyeriana var. granulata]|uniref:Uncharacterized protein n=1 Tax=Oryza meyeriana var. granulata TaxID=110450 RepID=A0A6G1BMG5_9ORYZ|nr:hypothetical protein E2562_020172 [Oryza meyeriana var. granulata]
MSSTTATTCSSGGLHAGGEWLGELSAELQEKWQAMVSARSSGDQRRRQRDETRRVVHGQKKGVAAGGGERRKEEGDVGACGGAMSDATVFLLLDHFAPS